MLNHRRKLTKQIRGPLIQINAQASAFALFAAAGAFAIS
jgi:hypothetical protein